MATFAFALALLAAGAASASASVPRHDPRIVGGSATTIEQWPWQVAIASNPDLAGGDGYDRQFCGGSLVAPTIVVTAGHCVARANGANFVRPGRISVIAGRTTLSSSEGQEVDVDEIYYFVETATGGVAPEAQTAPGVGDVLFDDFTLEWDAVFLELSSPTSAPAAPIKIAGPDEVSTWAPNRPAFVTGWGNTAFPGVDFPDDLHAAAIEMISDADCGSPSVYGSEFLEETMVCAGFLAGGVDTCNGDSGGPLVVPLLGGGFRLVGSTSWGFGCALPDAPGVYGRLADDPLRSALATGIQEVADVNVLGSGGQPVPPPTPPPGPPPQPSPAQPESEPAGTAANEACATAEERLRAAEKQLRKAKKKLKKAKKRGKKKKIKRARKKVKQAKQLVRSATEETQGCAGTAGRRDGRGTILVPRP